MWNTVVGWRVVFGRCEALLEKSRGRKETANKQWEGGNYEDRIRVIFHPFTRVALS